MSIIGTRAWRRLRTAHAHTLPQPCPFCHAPVNPGDTWHLDHATPRIHGGTDATLRPAHAHCNLAAGSQLRRDTRPRTPSRQW